jgi:tetratricopeptide (TPR) repeat protein
MFFSAYPFLLSLLVLAAQARKDACNTAAVFAQVDTQLAAHQYDLATRSLDGIRSCPMLSDIETFQLGWLYGRARHFDVALKVFERVPANVPDRPTHDFAVALTQFELGDYRGAANVLAALDSAGLAESKSVNLLAVSYSKLGLYREAYAVLTKEVGKNPADLDTHLNLITVCAEGGDFKSAAEAASATAKLFPASADAFVARGAAEALLGELNPAYDDFSHSAQLDPRRPDIRFFQALMDYKMGKFADAVQILDTAIKGGLDDSDLHYLLAECLLNTENGNRDAALAALNRAIALNGDSVSARTMRGKLLLEAGHADQAVRDLELANKQEPESRSAGYNLARAYRALGREAEAQAIFRKIHDQPASTVTEIGERRLNDALSEKSAGQK